MNQTFTVFDTLREAWKLTTGAMWSICAPIFFSLIFLYSLSFILKKIAIPIPFFSTIFLFCFTVFWMSGVVAGVSKIAIERARENPISAKMGFQYFSRALSSIVMAIIVFLPLLLSGSIFFMNFSSEASFSPTVSMILYPMYFYQILYGPLAFAFLCLTISFVVDKKIAVFSAISLSIKTTRRHIFKLIGLEVIGVLLFCCISIPWYLLGNTLGYYFQYVALFWLVPFQFMVVGVIYHKLIDENY